MRTSLYLAITLLLAGSAGASHVSSFLASYNISQSVISALAYTNITFSGHTYTLAYYSSKPTFLINTSPASYQFVLSPDSIYSIIRGTIINSSLAQINTTLLTSYINQYNSSVSRNMTDCLQETGLANGGTCTIANYCQACLSSEICSAILVGSTRLHSSGVGYGGSFEYGVINFEANYTNLRLSYSSLINNISTLNASDAQSNLQNIKSAFAEYSQITQAIADNPIFPPPKSADFAQCAGYGASTSNIISSSGPWYCNAVSLCTSLNYNYTLLGEIQGRINVMGSLPVSSTQIMQVAQNVSASEDAYAGKVIAAQKLSQLNGVLNTTLSGYGTLVNNTHLLLSRLDNASLSSSLAALTSSYSNLSGNYESLNISALNKTLAKQIASVRSQYDALNATYSELVALSNNNTRMLLEIQSATGSPQSLQLSFEQAQIDSQLSSKISDVGSVKSNLSSLNKQIALQQPLPNIPDALARAIDAPVAGALLSSAGYSQAVRLAPLYSVIPAAAIGIVILLLIFMFQKSMRTKRRIVVNRRTRRNWRIVFGIAVGLVVVLILATYLAAMSASSSAPLSAAEAAIGSSHTVVVALNGTANAQMSSCAAEIRSSLSHDGKSVISASISGVSCAVGPSVQTADRCMSSYASSNIPVIIISNSTHDSISAYSYYGTVMYQSGTPQFTARCLADLFVK